MKAMIRAGAGGVHLTTNLSAQANARLKVSTNPRKA